MSFLSVIKVELIKLYHKRITLLLLILFLTPVLFGLGMRVGLSFFVSDGGDGGVEAVASGFSGMRFVVDMLGQSNYILFLVTIILAAINFSGELENGQIKSAIIRICSRSKILIAKYAALLIAVTISFILFVAWTLLIYIVLVRHTDYANGQIFDSQILSQLGYLFFQWLAVAAAMSFTFLMGIKLKTFPCFAISYIAWFASLYSKFMDQIKLLFPINMPDFILENDWQGISAASYAGLYTDYCVLLILLSALLFKYADIKK